MCALHRIHIQRYIRVYSVWTCIFICSLIRILRYPIWSIRKIMKFHVKLSEQCVFISLLFLCSAPLLRGSSRSIKILLPRRWAGHTVHTLKHATAPPKPMDFIYLSRNIKKKNRRETFFVCINSMAWIVMCYCFSRHSTLTVIAPVPLPVIFFFFC